MVDVDNLHGVADTDRRCAGKNANDGVNRTPAHPFVGLAHGCGEALATGANDVEGGRSAAVANDQQFGGCGVGRKSCGKAAGSEPVIVGNDDGVGSRGGGFLNHLGGKRLIGDFGCGQFECLGDLARAELLEFGREPIRDGGRRGVSRKRENQRFYFPGNLAEGVVGLQ